MTGGDEGPREWVLGEALADWIASRCGLDQREVEHRLDAAMREVWSDPANFRLRARRQRSHIANWLPLEVDRSAWRATVRVKQLLTRGDGGESGYGWAVLAGMLGLDVRHDWELLAQHGKRYLLEVDGNVVAQTIAAQQRARAAPVASEPAPSPPLQSPPVEAKVEEGSGSSSAPEPKQQEPAIAPGGTIEPTEKAAKKGGLLTPAMIEIIDAYRRGNPKAGHRRIQQHLADEHKKFPSRQAVRDHLMGRDT